VGLPRLESCTNRSYLSETFKTANGHYNVNRYGIVEFNVPLDTVYNVNTNPLFSVSGIALQNVPQQPQNWAFGVAKQKDVLTSKVVQINFDRSDTDPEPAASGVDSTRRWHVYNFITPPKPMFCIRGPT